MDLRHLYVLISIYEQLKVGWQENNTRIIWPFIYYIKFVVVVYLWLAKKTFEFLSVSLNIKLHNFRYVNAVSVSWVHRVHTRMHLKSHKECLGYKITFKYSSTFFDYVWHVLLNVLHKYGNVCGWKRIALCFPWLRLCYQANIDR